MGPERFEIVVRGQMGTPTSTAITNFEVTTYEEGLTHLVGWVPDQARLYSILERLRDLNIELVAVHQVPAF